MQDWVRRLLADLTPCGSTGLGRPVISVGQAGDFGLHCHDIFRLSKVWSAEMSHPLSTVLPMRFLHTSDWHLGRSFHGEQLLDAQVHVLEALVNAVQAESIDVVVIAGDIYDRAIPSADAVRALDHVLAEIRGAGAQVIGISGNHDSSVRLGFGERVFSEAGVTLRGDISAAGQPVIVPERDGSGAVAFYPIPYIEPESARVALDVDTRCHDRLLSTALDLARRDLSSRDGMRSVAIAHAFVTGGVGCDSELELSVGGSSEVGLKRFNGFDYVALGHLHGRQPLGNGKARYSGTPLPYSFSERTHTKGAWIVDLDSAGNTLVEPLDLPQHRRLFQLRGSLEELLVDTSMADAEQGYVQAILTDPLLPMGSMERLRRRFPHAVLLSHEPPARTGEVSSYADRVRGKNDLELALEFIEHVAGRPADKYECAELRSAVEVSVMPGSERAA